jgi:hypothetical protein
LNILKIEKNKLDKNGIPYFIRKNAIFEPSAQNNPYATKLDVIYISPEAYRNATHPWNEDLDQYLIEIWNSSYNGEVVAKLYSIKLN